MTGTVWVVQQMKGGNWPVVGVYDNEAAARNHGKNINQKWGIFLVSEHDLKSL